MRTAFVVESKGEGIAILIKPRDAAGMRNVARIPFDVFEIQFASDCAALQQSLDVSKTRFLNLLG